MKKEGVLVGLILLHLLILTPIVQVQAADTNYALGIKKDMEITLEIKTLDKDGLKEVFGDAWKQALPEGADELGLRYKIKVKEVDEDTEIDLGILGEYDAFGFEADIWEWTKGDFAEEPTEDEVDIVWFQDPEDMNDAYKDVNGYAYDITMPFVPIDVVKFLDKIDEWKEDNHEEWKNKDNMVIHDSISDEKENFLEIYIYDTQTGFLTGYKIIDEGGTVIYEYGSSQFIPGYEIPIILGIIGIFTIGLIYIMKKRYNLI